MLKSIIGNLKSIIGSGLKHAHDNTYTFTSLMSCINCIVNKLIMILQSIYVVLQYLTLCFCGPSSLGSGLPKICKKKAIPQFVKV